MRGEDAWIGGGSVTFDASAEVPVWGFATRMADAARLQAELDALKQERRQAERNLRELDSKAGGARAGGPAVLSSHIPPGFDTARLQDGARLRHPGRLEGRLGGGMQEGLQDRRGAVQREVAPGVGDRLGKVRAPHPWDPRPKAVEGREGGTGLERGSRLGVPPAMRIRSTIAKRGAEPDSDDDQRDAAGSRKRARESSDEEEGRMPGSTDGVTDTVEDTDREIRQPPPKREKPAPQRPGGRGAVRKPDEQSVAAVQQRNRRLFGGLLGHLKKAKQEEDTMAESEASRKRQALLEAAEMKAKEGEEQLRERRLAERREEREKAREERAKNLTKIREIRKKQEEALHALALLRGPAHAASLGRYIRTESSPHIFWLPKTVKEGLTEITNPKVEAQQERTRKKLEEEMEETRARLEAQRAEDLAAEEERQAAFEARQRERMARRTAMEEEEGGKEERERERGGGSADEEEEEREDDGSDGREEDIVDTDAIGF